MTEEQLEQESLRLETDYNERWMEYEGFNLEEAFKLQSLKIDAEYRCSIAKHSMVMCSLLC